MWSYFRVIGLIGFIAFDHGLPYYGYLGTGWDKFSIGLFQSVSTRATGFYIVSLSDLAPAMESVPRSLFFSDNVIETDHHVLLNSFLYLVRDLLAAGEISDADYHL